jgi:hypothetical protein
MRRAKRIIGHFLAVFLLMRSSVAGADLFQWTDPSGVIHFTDNPYALPESVRNSAMLVVRKDFLISSGSGPETTPTVESIPLTGKPEAKKDPELDSKLPGVTAVTTSPQEITVLIVNSNVRRTKIKPCGSSHNCKPGFRPDFNNRQYIHPSVFSGGSRQYIHPR